MNKPILVRGRAITSALPALICVSLTGRNANAIREELDVLLPKTPDIFEWRVDFFEEIHNQSLVIEMAKEIRQRAGTTPIIFTRRAAHEGGEPIALPESAVVDLYRAVCESGAIDFVDVELSQPDDHRWAIRFASTKHHVGYIASFHDFVSTPPSETLIEKMQEAVDIGADIAKIAVMPQSESDVTRLLEATREGATRIDIPLITMSMGSLGAVSREIGWKFGSAVTFAAGQKASAPGQTPIDALRAAMGAAASIA